MTLLQSMDRKRLLVIALGVEGAVLLAAFALGWATDVPPFGLLRVSVRGLVAGVLAAAGMLAALLAAARSTWPPLARLSVIVREIVAVFFARATLLDLAIVSALAGIAEEALFRGVLQVALAGPMGTVPALAATAVLFGIAHSITLTYAVVATAVGALLGGLLVVTGDLAAPIVAHALYDFVALAWLVRRAGRSEDDR